MFYSLQQLPLIFLLIYQQIICHGSWATRTSITAASTAQTTTATTFTTALPLAIKPLVTSSEATLLTAPELVSTVAKNRMPQQIDYGDDENFNDNTIEFNEIPTSVASNKTAADTTTTTTTTTTNKANKRHNSFGHNSVGGNRSKQQQQRFKIVQINTNCTRDLFEMHIELNHGFRGLLYAKDFPLECRARGNAQTNVNLRLPTSGCGVRAEPRADGNMELSVRIMLQVEQKLRQSSDILRTVRCTLPANAMGMNVFLASAVNRGRFGSRNARMRTVNKNVNNNNNNKKNNNTNKENTSNNSYTKLEQSNEDLNQMQASAEQSTYETNTTNESNDGASTTTTATTTTTSTSTTSATTTTTTPRVRIWLELGGPNGSGSVEVGVATTLTVRAIVPGTMGVRVVECAALDGLGESTQQLLDERGCPIDEQVMPELNKRFKPAEEGWSKLNEDDLVEKTFTATFPAFKFPDRERLHVSCGVQLCKGKCPDINCRTADKLILSTDKHLARIEVFNSLAVTAPQIEVDRLRYDRHNNMSDEYSPYVRAIPTEGTLCLSVSKLALSFCILGLIFLLAIIVAICSLIRSRRRAAAHSGYHAGGCSGSNGSSSRAYRTEICTSMFSSSSESAQSARFGSKLLIPYYPNTLPYGRVY